MEKSILEQEQKKTLKDKNEFINDLVSKNRKLEDGIMEYSKAIQ